ncbi:hypothetical protein BHYA_0127g00210 [Botrytis hyacinthi]|uniref:Uncharacterized protein n=1 Tax=Botrytis hyacinthi TaxID=278943 RepID=A0A4Z1GHK0_9HELO|nr:hypothetical protein BHYA_0127g00210 [Botrytis hyacinthi]
MPTGSNNEHGRHHSMTPAANGFFHGSPIVPAFILDFKIPAWSQRRSQGQLARKTACLRRGGTTAFELLVLKTD